MSNPQAGLHYQLLDVFTRNPLEGNPLAVFLDCPELDGDLMQRIARELNLSEIVFVTRSPQADCAARLRIFTPGTEMQFAGHPTIGAAFALWQSGANGTQTRSFAFKEHVGRVPVRIDNGEPPMVWLSTPPISKVQDVDRTAAAHALGVDESDLIAALPCELLTAGNPTLYVPLRDKDAVDRAWPDTAMCQRMQLANDRICMLVFTPTEQGAYTRVFGHSGVGEDPATGSSTGPLAAYMMRHGLVSQADGAEFVSEQGVSMRRRSLLHVRIRGEHGNEGIDVGGHVRAVGRGVLEL